jgi:L-seryl-tRNA(Ser) seleniumtransferase
VAAAGGGSLPTQDIPTIVLTVKHKMLAANRMEALLRQAPTPIIVRVNENEILIDLRTVAEDEFAFIVDGLRRIAVN